MRAQGCGSGGLGQGGNGGLGQGSAILAAVLLTGADGHSHQLQMRGASFAERGARLHEHPRRPERCAGPLALEQVVPLQLAIAGA
eukprot:1566017-Pleurochrysis_carterae.AAC.1